MMKKVIAAFLPVFLSVLVVACEPATLETSTTPISSSSSNSPTTYPTLLAQLVKSDVGRNLSPYIGPAELQSLVKGNSEFALDLFHALSGESANLFFSPYSLSLALAMAYAGARGETETEMAGVLHFDLGQDRLHEGFNYLAQELAKRTGPDVTGKGSPFRLNVINDAWGLSGYPFLQPYLDILAADYGAGMETIDFERSLEGARQAINKYISEQTEGRIPELLDSIEEETRLILTAAIYFIASWWSEFDKANTRNGTFHLLDGGSVAVPMMNQTTGFQWAGGEDYDAVQMWYEGNKLAMLLILPEQGHFEEFQQRLDAGMVEDIVARLSATGLVDLTLPKFSFSSELKLRNVLGAMGMTQAFSGDADFSGITSKGGLFLTDVVHSSFISVDEQGTEAAAGSGARIAAGISRPEKLVFDRPFIFLIRDIPTNTILFLGRVTDPAAS